MNRRVLFVSGREAGYMRNRVLLAALRLHHDVTVIAPRWGGIPGRVLGGVVASAFAAPDYDVYLAGFYGQPLAIGLAAQRRRPVVLDAFVSTFDTLCDDRRWFSPRSLPGRAAYWLDQRSLDLSAHVLTDSGANADYFAGTFAVERRKLTPIYVGCDESLFSAQYTVRPHPAQCEVFYYGAFLPLHGTEVIVKAADRLRGRRDIHFTIGGQGPRFAAVRKMMHDLRLTNVDLVGWVPVEKLAGYIASANICLGGHFSTVPKAARVIATKTFQFVAMRRATIVGDNAATREVFRPGMDISAVPMGDAGALAAAIGNLADNPTERERLAEGGYAVYQQRLTTAAIAKQVAAVIEQATCASA